MKARISFHPALLKQAVLNQVMELYRLGIEVEAERSILEDYIEQYGLSDPATLTQSQKLDRLLNKFAALEKKHIKDTEQLAGIGKKALL